MHHKSDLIADNCVKSTGGGISIKISLLASVFALAVAPAYAAEWYGTSLDAEGHAQWNDAENWDSATGVPVVNINFTESVINGTNGSKTVWLDNLYNFSGDYHLYAGTESAPLTFKANGSNGFAATENKQMYVGNGSANPAYVVLDGGTYTFKNDLAIGFNQADATLVVKEGTRVQLPHWTRIGTGSGSGESRLVIDGGEYVGGWRNEAESDNALISIADAADSKAMVILNSGRIRCAGNGSAGDNPFIVGGGTRSLGRFTMTDGTLDVNYSGKGRIQVGYGNTATGVVEIAGGVVNAASDVTLGLGANSYGTFEMSGGTVNVGSWFFAGRGNKSEGLFHATGGTINVAGEFRVGEGYNESDVKGTAVNDGGEWIVNGDFRIASDATRPTGTVTNNTGTITINNSKNLAVGSVADGNGALVVNGGAISAAGGQIFIGRKNVGTGYYEQTGGEVKAAKFLLGSQAGVGTGKMTGGTMALTGDLLIGEEASSIAEFNITGGTITASQFFVGNGNNADAKVSITNATISFSSWGAIGRDGTNRKGKVTVGEGGRLIHTATDNNTHLGIGNLGSTGENELVVEEGGYVEDGSDMWIGENAPATLTINGGTVYNPARYTIMNKQNQSACTSTINLNGGTLETRRVTTGGANGSAVINFNGGTLKAYSGSDIIINQAGNLKVNIGTNGGTIDTGTSRTQVTADLDSGVEEGETDGGLTVTGRGILALRAAANYNGLTYVESGVLALTNGYAFAGPVKVGKKGAIAVDITAARTAKTAAGNDLAVEDKIALFTTPSNVTFDLADDSLASTVFLTGPVVGYTLSYDETDDTVYATITDVANIDKSRKVTTFVKGVDGNGFVDNGPSFSNGEPTANSSEFDVVVFPGDALMRIWTKNNDRRFRAHGDLVVRGGTVWVKISDNDLEHSPRLGARHVAGNGTLKLSQVGLEAVDNMNGTLVVEPTVNVDFTCHESKPTYDTWITGRHTVDVKGDVYVTNGVMRVYPGAVFSGDVTIGYYQPKQSWLNDDGTVFNRNLILEDGATFNCNGKTAVFGNDARLVLKGGTLINTSNITAWPKTVIQGGVYAYGAVPGAAEYTIEGGKLNVVPTTDESGATMTLTGVTLADGVNAEDVIQMAGTNFKWRYTVDETTGVITAEAYEALDSSVPNEWIGGAQGLWKQASNWTRGIPTIDQTVVFNNDAICFYAEKQDVWGEAGVLDLNGHSVTIAASNYDIQYWGGLRIASFDENETGILNLWKAGIWNKNQKNLEFPATMKLTVAAPGSDCWIREYYAYVYVRCPVEVGAGMTFNLDYRVHLYGGVSGSGNVNARNKSADVDNTRFIGGDWSGFTGTYTGHAEDRTRFLDSFTGGENSTWSFPQYFRFDHMSGTVKFGQLTTTNDRHIEVLAGSTLTIEVGALNGNPSLNSGTCFYNNTASDWTGTWTQGSATATIRKVGTGTMSCGMIAAGNLDVAEGACSLTGGDADVNATVRDGATLQAANNATIGALTCEAGANIRLTTLESNPVITVAGTAVVDGANVTLADGLADTLYTQTDPASYTILNAGTISGTPAGRFPCNEENVFWIAKAASGTLNLTRRQALSGLFIIVH